MSSQWSFIKKWNQQLLYLKNQIRNKQAKKHKSSDSDNAREDIEEISQDIIESFENRQKEANKSPRIQRNHDISPINNRPTSPFKNRTPNKPIVEKDFKNVNRNDKKVVELEKSELSLKSDAENTYEDIKNSEDLYKFGHKNLVKVQSEQYIQNKQNYIPKEAILNKQEILQSSGSKTQFENKPKQDFKSSKNSIQQSQKLLLQNDPKVNI